MPIKLILVPLSAHYNSDDPHTLEEPALEAAFRIGKTFDARVRVFLIEAPRQEARKKLAPWLPDYGLDELFKMFDTVTKQRREYALETFRATQQRLMAPLVSERPGSGFAVEFLEDIGDVPRSLASHGRLADLLVVAHPHTDSSHGDSQLLEVALRETGRPVLVTPSTNIATTGEHIAIAWNGSSEAARAIALSLELLSRAKQVTIIAVTENGGVEPSGQQLADYLGMHAIQASTVTVEGSAHSAGACILTGAAHAGADLLLMGAYTRSRTRQLIFGGATGHILRETTIPVVMVD